MVVRCPFRQQMVPRLSRITNEHYQTHLGLGHPEASLTLGRADGGGSTAWGGPISVCLCLREPPDNYGFLFGSPSKGKQSDTIATDTPTWVSREGHNHVGCPILRTP